MGSPKIIRVYSAGGDSGSPEHLWGPSPEEAVPASSSGLHKALLITLNFSVRESAALGEKHKEWA